MTNVSKKIWCTPKLRILVRAMPDESAMPDGKQDHRFCEVLTGRDSRCYSHPACTPKDGVLDAKHQSGRRGAES